jgi:hypothetical protein
MEKRYQSFEEFWPFYLSQHVDGTCRNLHLVGTSLGIVFLVWVFATAHFALVPLAFIIGYAFSWVGHFFFEHNRPATFLYPRWSFQGDFRMMKLFYTGRLPAELKKLGHL